MGLKQPTHGDLTRQKKSESDQTWGNHPSNDN
jgi:hypothetical protein